MQRDFATEIVIAMERGVDKYLAASIKYAPFRIFYNLFKKANPILMDQIRGAVRNDVYNVITAIPGFSFEVFLVDDELQPKGKQLLQICYNIGIHILKKQLNVRMAFKVVTNSHVRNQIYSYILNVVERSTSRILHNN